jgi:hypothetical protein
MESSMRELRRRGICPEDFDRGLVLGLMSVFVYCEYNIEDSNDTLAINSPFQINRPILT